MLFRSFTPHAEAGPNHRLQQSELIERQTLQQVIDLPEEAFTESLSAYSDGISGNPPILIYIHGYKKSFKRASEITAQLRYELAFPGPVILFSWPSTNTVSGYVADLENMNWSKPQLLDLIILLNKRFPDSPIHIIAHSMGNRALLDILPALRQRFPEPGTWPLGEIVLIAPDYDRDIFIRDVADFLETIPSRKTLYVSAKDFQIGRAHV